MTYREAVEFGTKCLTDAGVPDAALDAWYLLQMVCKIERSYYYVHGEEDITQDAQKEYEIAVQKRAEHIPLQYIIGEQEFMGLRFKVNSECSDTAAGYRDFSGAGIEDCKAGDESIRSLYRVWLCID